jgi:hypothetical protein
MKIRQLKRKAGMAVMSVWPPQWASAYRAGDYFATGEEGVLHSVRRTENRLDLTMWWSGREHFGVLEWTPPPALETVENVLRAHIGEPIQTIGDIDI